MEYVSDPYSPDVAWLIHVNWSHDLSDFAIFATSQDEGAVNRFMLKSVLYLYIFGRLCDILKPQ